MATKSRTLMSPAQYKNLWKSRPGKKHQRKFTLPLALVAGMAPIAIQTVNYARINGIQYAVNHLSRVLTGYNPDDQKFYPVSCTERGVWGETKESPVTGTGLLSVSLLTHKRLLITTLPWPGL